ncbi:hypothetical protein VPH35_107063 [Triticum aestivum]
MEAAAPSAALRVYGPSNFRDDELVFNSGEIGRLESELRAKIESCYGRVRQLPGVLDAGFCFGLLDPVSNIVAGASIARAAVEAKEEEEEEERSLPGARLGEPDLIGDMNRRSFHGLVDFLTALFPHLTNAMARLDPLVAALLIVKRRGMERSFGFASDTTAAAVETALRCAAASAQHPNPSQFALGWKLLSHSELNNVAAVLPSSANSDYSDESFAAAIAMVDDVLLKKQPQPTSVLSLEKSWELASARLRNLGPDLSPIVLEKKVFLERAAVWRMLLTTIHGYYLQALARLPKDKLQSHYHHSLLQAGHCYGPLDPVGNIILNTIWYSRAYPPAKNVEISAISTRGLLRIAVRSLYGLVSFLCTRCAATHLTPDEAIRRLQAVAADLRLADPNLLLDDDKNDDDMVVSATVEQAYTAAAAAARHPEPHHQVELLRPCNSVLRMASDRLKGDAMLPHEDAEHLSESMRMLSMLLSEHQQQPETKIKVLDRWAHIRVQHRINKFWDQHARLVGMAKSAMDSYSNELGVGFLLFKTLLSLQNNPCFQLTFLLCLTDDSRYPVTSSMLSAVPMSMLMVLCAQGLAKATTVAPTSTSLLPNLLLHLRRSSLLNVPMMAQRYACAALCVCCLQALNKSVACTVSTMGVGLYTQQGRVSVGATLSLRRCCVECIHSHSPTMGSSHTAAR